LTETTHRTTGCPTPAELARLVRDIGTDVTGPAAIDVDRQARFPHETIDALRRDRVLSACVPVELGGSGCNVLEMAELCNRIARHCSSSGMILAMHLIQLECIVQHYKRGGWFEGYLRDMVAEQRLIASVTSAAGIGGDLRRSQAALSAHDGRSELVKESTCVSYGGHADDLLITCRRDAAASPSAQALVLAKAGQFALEQHGEWNTLGMRGTCSPAFTVKIDVPDEQVLEVPFAKIALRTMIPVSHVLWSSVWLGIATDAVLRASEIVRAKHRAQPESSSGPATRLAHLDCRLQLMRSGLDAVAQEYQRALDEDDEEHLSSLTFSLAINNLKINSSELVVEIVTGALRLCGFAGYANESPYSVGRHLRDAHSAALMIANDRILGGHSRLMLLPRDR
jgi:acyl-CoA dehydrogenase